MIRVDVLGGGVRAQHLDAYQALDAFDVTHLADQDATRRDALCKGKITGVETIKDALSADVDLIDICLPPHLHAPVAIAALEAGKHVICEKPLGTSMAQVDAIAAAADKANKRVFPVFQYRFGPAFAQLGTLRAGGLTGVPRAAALETHWNRDADYYAILWHGTWAGEPGGAVLGHAIHARDLLAHFMAPIKGVTARLNTLVNEIETEDTAALIFDLKGGALATSSITLGSAADETRLRFVYKHLTATSHTNPYASGEGAWTFTARDRSRQHIIDAVLDATSPGLSGFAGFLNEVGGALRGTTNSAVCLQEGAASITLVTGIYASHRSGERVALPLPIDDTLYEGWQL